MRIYLDGEYDRSISKIGTAAGRLMLTHASTDKSVREMMRTRVLEILPGDPNEQPHS